MKIISNIIKFMQPSDTETKVKQKVKIKTILIATGGILALSAVATYALGFIKISSPSANQLSALKAAPITRLSLNKDVTVELDLPGYLPAEFKHPQKIFSGRTLKISSGKRITAKDTTLIQEKTKKRINLSPKKEKGDKAYTVEIPLDTPSGNNILSVSINGQTQDFEIQTQGLTSAEINAVSAPVKRIYPALLGESGPQVMYRNIICKISCNTWEMVFGGILNDPSKLIYSSMHDLSRSSDGGRSWTTAVINNLLPPELKANGFVDNKIVGLSQDKFMLSVMPSSDGYTGGALFKGAIAGNLEGGWFQGIPSNPNEFTPSVVVDYPKIVVDESRNTVFIAANAVWDENQNSQYQGVYVSKDGGTTFSRYIMDYNAYPEDNWYFDIVTSIDIDENGTLFGVFMHPEARTLVRYDSFEPLRINKINIPVGVISGEAPAVKLFSSSNRGWIKYNGPEILIDKNPGSLFRGRMYILWAKPERIIENDPAFEWKKYGYNHDIFLSYSDDKGQTWSQAVRINDETNQTDQFFPSFKLDPKGNIHVAFVDHRNYPDQPLFDVYYSYSSDGGAHFSPNLRVSTDEKLLPNSIGGRSIGDYLDMVMVYENKTYVAYPCFDGVINASSTAPNAACFTEITIVPSDNLPTISWVSPAAGATLAGNVTLTANAADDKGVTKVEFYRDNQILIASDTTAPYQSVFDTKSAENGVHILYAKAYDSLGQSAASAGVSVTIKNDLPPNVSITAPTVNSAVSGNITISANADDETGVRIVYFYVDSASAGSDTTAPYEISWYSKRVANGAHNVYAKAYDTKNKVTISAKVPINVQNDSIKPTVSLTAPVSNSTVKGSVLISANASDNIGVKKVEFYLDTSKLIGSVNASPYQISWDSLGVADGSHTLYAKAYDSSDNTTNSSSLSFTVKNAVPSVLITAPVSGSTVSGFVTINVSVSGLTEISSVKFYRDSNTVISTDTSLPFSARWDSSGAGNGNHTLYARAFDASGNYIASSPINVVVNNDTAPPTVAITAPANNSSQPVDSTVLITAVAQDNVAVTKVSFYVDGLSYCTDTTAPYSCSWIMPNPPQAHTIKARAYDARNNTSYSEVVTINGI